MTNSKIDHLLKRLQQYTFSILLIQICLIMIAAWLCWKSFLHAGEKYFLELQLAGLLTAAGLLLFLATRSIIVFKTKSPEFFARRLDHDYKLKDRITTYLQLRSSQHPFLQALEHEAENRISQISPLRASRLSQGTLSPFLIAVLFFISLIALPYLPIPASVAQRKAERSQIQKQAHILEGTIRKIQKENPQLPELQKLFEEWNQLTRDLQNSKMDKIEALKRLNTMKEQLQILEENLQKSRQNALAQELQQMLSNQNGTVKGDGENQKLQELLDQMQKSNGSQESLSGEKIEDAIGKMNLSKDQIRKLKQAIEDYDRSKAESDKRMSEMREALNQSQKQLASGKGKVTYDSKMNSRDVEKSKGGVEDGPGTTNQDIGPQSFDTKKKGKGEYAEDRTKAKYENIYKGEREDVGKDPLFLNNSWNDSADPKYVPIRTFGMNSEALVQNSTPETVNQEGEESEIRKEKIPASYQKIVKEYFEAIQE